MQVNVIRVWVPQADNSGERTDVALAVLGYVETALCEHAGGATVTEGSGIWVEPRTGARKGEPVWVVEALTDTSFTDALALARELGRYVVRMLAQDAALILVNQHREFVLPPAPVAQQRAAGWAAGAERDAARLRELVTSLTPAGWTEVEGGPEQS